MSLNQFTTEEVITLDQGTFLSETDRAALARLVAKSEGDPGLSANESKALLKLKDAMELARQDELRKRMRDLKEQKPQVGVTIKNEPDAAEEAEVIESLSQDAVGALMVTICKSIEPDTTEEEKKNINWQAQLG